MVPVPPFAIASVPVIVERVEVAIHAGFPFWSVRINPSVDEATVVKEEAEFAYNKSPEVNDVNPVPPLFAAIAVAFHVPDPIVPSVVRFVDPAHVDSAVFSTLSSARVAFKFAVVVPASVPVPEAYKTVPDVYEVRPVPPFATARVPVISARVEVATHVGVVPFKASTYPAVPAEVVARAPVPLPKTTAPAATFPHPVPPFATPRMPVMSLVRLMSDVATTPAVALRKPVTCPNVNAVEATSCEVDASVEMVTLVVDAFASVVFPVVFSVPSMVTLPEVSIVVEAVPPILR